MAIMLKVSTNELTAKSNQIQSEIEAIRREFSSIGSIVNSSSGYWRGDASNQHKNYYKRIEPDMMKALKRLGEHPKDLLQMAGIYESAEAEAAETATSLPADVIE